MIVLNGTSSAGKTTFARALQENSQHHFLRVGIDQMIEMMPERVNSWTGEENTGGFSLKKVSLEGEPTAYAVELGPFAHKVRKTFREVVRTMALEGHFLIVDDVYFGKEEVVRWKEALEGIRTLYVGLKVPLDVLEQREKARGDRMIGSARGLYALIHEGISYDVEIESPTESLSDAVAKVLGAI